ncbi:hypothetical protein CPB84DRAFT_1677667 [Gymnopilus junonius]|uniref:Uncharacterized protein n=1 Tax=Gymnopilus junonius TaxID=109634 RepID=A0A9P5NRG8_GYMJU|nr:hypothetical protein CPB84DRAFT_1677667 [Gymnopilus junonius]
MKMQPLTVAEQYWATRALKAEALLVAQENHKEEVKRLEHVQEFKKEREFKMLAQEYREKHAALEKLLFVLALLIILLIAVIIYLATHYTRHSMLMQHKQHERWWSAIGASHFTIPILSPFTSVVEQETSVIGSKLIGTLAAVIACLAYLAFRHWLKRKPMPNSSFPANVLVQLRPQSHAL